MRKIYAIIICLCAMASSYAQQNNQSQGQRQGFSPEAFNHGLEQFVKKEADLSDQECQKFFPMMHEMMNKQRELNGKIQYTMVKGFNAKTEADYEQIISQVTNLEVERTKLEQVYYKKFHSVLTWKKILKVRVALSRFNMEALRIFSPTPQNQQRQGWQGGNRGQMPQTMGFPFGQQGQRPNFQQGSRPNFQQGTQGPWNQGQGQNPQQGQRPNFQQGQR